MTWSNADEQYLIDHYGRQTGDEIAATLGRTGQAVRYKAKRLGLSKARHPLPKLVREGDICRVPLSSGKWPGHFAIVDADQMAKVSPHSWSANRMKGGKFYARARINGRVWRMHAYLMRVDDGHMVDHKDGDGLNNRMSNLRPATHSQNMANRGFEGVVGVDEARGRFRARFRHRHLGMFDSMREAARAYNDAALAAHGEFASLNDLDAIPA